MWGKISSKTNCLPWVYARSKFSKIFNSFFRDRHSNGKPLETIACMNCKFQISQQWLMEIVTCIRPD